MARYSKKRARQLKQDVFRDRAMSAFEQLGDRLEGKGRTILYAIAAIIVLGAIAGFLSWHSRKKDEEARQALGRAIEIATAPITTTPFPGSAFSFPTEKERAQRAVEEFQKVAAKYGDPYRSEARYLAAVNLLTIDPNKGASELEALGKGSDADVAAWAKFALAQHRAASGQYDAAVAIYNELAGKSDSPIPADTIKLQLAGVYEKQGKKKEAADLLFSIVEAARKAQSADGRVPQQSAAARAAADKLEELDPARFAQLPPAPESNPLNL